MRTEQPLVIDGCAVCRNGLFARVAAEQKRLSGSPCARSISAIMTKNANLSRADRRPLRVQYASTNEMTPEILSAHQEKAGQETTRDKHTSWQALLLF
jgi:hypothetical protein